ncbi:MAG: 5-formyltetrahydrofolate cyclo-ligase [Gemmatimonadetes bacterium]|jgi:5-formyltetrahydrofolate cyclo-ligase|nr:5-formyltetrahydrofolate cyclo-ligase [Gemmatimonadota bacterium]MBT7861474.1 5-formyltetrahydrofolate cyclo-ligase [Gemmatimonadota bacterium]
MTDCDLDKQRLRHQALRHRRRMTGDEVRTAGLSLHQHVRNWPIWDRIRTIHTYVDALPGEIPTRPLIETALAAGWRVTIPVVDAEGQLCHSHLSDPADLQRGRMRLWEPMTPHWVEDLSDLDLILVPGAAFDRDGGRVGLGGGYYDRLLAELPKSTLRAGFVYDAWLLDKVPTDTHDQPVDVIFTEMGLHTTKRDD